MKRYAVSLLYRNGSKHALCGWICYAYNQDLALLTAVDEYKDLEEEGYSLRLNVVLEIHESRLIFKTYEPDRS